MARGKGPVLVSRWVLGIDPGCPGALALFDPGGTPVEVREGPWRWKTLKGGQRRRKIDGPILHGLLHTFRKRANGAPTVAIIEEVHAMPTDGAVQAFAFGGSCTAWEQAAEVEGWELRYVVPQVWQKTVPGISGAGKERKLSYHAAALTRWPEWRSALEGPREGPRLDPAAALWIGEWGRRFCP